MSAEDTPKRDKWVVALNDLLDSWEEHPESRPKQAITQHGASNKAEYFEARENEIKKREEEAEEKKKKYSTGGMKYTAMAMANMGATKT